MELLTALFVFSLYKATEKIWEKGFDAAWGPVDETLKARFTRWAGKGKEAERKAAFEKAAKIARTNTLHTAADPQQAARILDALDGERDKKGAQALAEEAAKLMLFSAAPDVPRLAELCRHTLSFDALYAGGTPPPAEAVAAVLSDFLTDLREALLDQEPYHDLVQREMLRTLREIVAELRPVAYDDEATYRAQMAEMYRQLEFVGIPELKERRPITVEDIFIRLRIITEGIKEALSILTPRERRVLQLRDGLVDGRAYSVDEVAPKFGLTVEEIQSIEEAARARLPIVSETMQVHEAVQRYTRLVVLGNPGAGKTTLLKYLTVICAEGRAEAELGLKADGAGAPLPVLIPLREFAAECAERDQDYCLLDYLYTHAREHLMLNIPRSFFEEALEAGRCLVCLDGLDEVWAVGQRKAITDEVKALAARFPHSRYIVTSRSVGYEEAPLDRRDFVHHTVLPLTDDDIREFVRKWYKARERDPVQRKQKAESLITTIEREPRIRTLAENPLLLTIIALVHRIEAELPHERVKLYDKCVTALVDTWEEVKGLTIEEKQRPFYRQRRRLLERLAYELHVQAEKPGQLQTIKVGDLELLLTRFLTENRRLGLADDPDAARDEARAFIRLARGRTGLLVERGEGVFGFPHLTFQEYLAACDVENRCMPYGINAIWEEIKDHLHDPHWREVILLLLGSLNRYEDAPTLLVERILEAGRGDKFEPVLHRCLCLAARALADKVDIADPLYRQIVNELLAIVRHAQPTSLTWGPKEIKMNDPGGDAITGLVQLRGNLRIAEGLLTMARDPEVELFVHIAAACALGQLGCFGEKILDGLLALARDEQMDAWVHGAAASALGQLGHAEEKVLDGLLALARDAQVDAEARSAAASALGQLGCTEEAAEVLLALARNAQVDAWVHHATASALGQLGHTEEAAEALLALARDEQMDAWVRSVTASALGRLGHTEEATEVLLALTRDEQVSGRVRRDAAQALDQLGHAEESVEVLLALARDEQVNGLVRRDAAQALDQLGHVEESVEILLALARDGQVEAEVRCTAASTLGQLGHAEEKVLDGLLALARDKRRNAGMRCAAASALGQLGCTEEAAEVLLALARNAQVDADVRRDAAEALGRLVRAEEAGEILLALACDAQGNAGVRCDAASALGQLGYAEESAEILLTLARDEQMDARVRSDAYESLKRLVGGATANSE